MSKGWFGGEGVCFLNSRISISGFYVPGYLFFVFHPRNVISCVCSETSPAVTTALKEFGYRYVNIIVFNFFTINWVSGET